MRAMLPWILFGQVQQPGLAGAVVEPVDALDVVAGADLGPKAGAEVLSAARVCQRKYLVMKAAPARRR